MTRLGSWLLVTSMVGAVACGGDNRPRVDGGDAAVADTGTLDGAAADGGDPCAGLTLCTTAGTSCTGDTLVTCAANTDGCLVETQTDCTATGGSCDATGTAMCVNDPCMGVDPADRCTTAGFTCESETLVECAADTNGCLVRTVTDCAASPGGLCDETATTPVCVLPPDPCASIPATDRCTTEGTSCTGNDLTTCAPDAFGCLVNAITACDSRAGGTCDATGTAQCTFTGDPCAGITQCATEGTSCNGPELVTCARDGFGCLVETTLDCTDTMFGFCDTAATPAQCSTAAVDPCMGMTLCTPEGRACDTNTLRVCARNAFGCLVETATDCTASGEICGDRGGMAVCDDVCSFRTTCPSMSYCDTNDAVTCANDADGCLVESSRTTCTGTTACNATSGTATCVDTLCPTAEATILDCASGTVSGNTMGGASVRNGYAGCNTLSYPGAERIYRFRNSGAERMAVRIVSTRGASTADFDLYAWDGGDGTSVSCTETTVTCLDQSTGVTATETIDFVAPAGTTQYVAYDLYNTATGSTDFTLAITCTPIVCGDGAVGLGETCDDGGMADMDGCSSVCTIEPGYGCTGTPSVCTPLCGNGTLNTGEGCDDGDRTDMDGCSSTCTIEPGYACSGAPSVCVPLAANATCAAATAVTGTTSITAENIGTGGPRPQGTNCGTSSGNNALYYSVTIPANTRVDVVTGNSSLDRVLLTQDACGDPACTSRIDSSPERTAFVNSTASPITRIVAIHNYSSAGTGTYDIAFTYTALAANATCGGAASPPASGDLRAGTGLRPTGPGCTSGTTGALYYAIGIPALSSATVTVTPTGTPSWNPAILAVADCTATACLTSRDSAGTGSPEVLVLSNTTGSPVTNVVAVTAGTTTVGTFDIAVATVAFEPNAVCSGATAPPDNADLRVGAGPRPTGTGCTTGGPALYYTVDIPPSSRAVVTATPTGAWNPALIVVPDCSGTSCSAASDTAGTSAPESIVLDNTTGSTVRRIVAVSTASTTVSGVFDVAVAFQALPYTLISASCIDTSAGTIVAGVATDDSASTISALPWSFSFFGTPVTHYSVSSNGIAQLWTSATGTPSTTYVNATIPVVGTPNGYVAPFWDDLRPNTGALARTLETGTPGDRRFVIEWTNWRATVGGTENLTFQAHFVEASGAIEYHYCSMTAGTDAVYTGSSATIGAESVDGASGLLISFNAAGTVATGSGFRFAP